MKRYVLFHYHHDRHSSYMMMDYADAELGEKDEVLGYFDTPEEVAEILDDHDACSEWEIGVEIGEMLMDEFKEVHEDEATE